ncbi:hypothetical protein ACFLXF_04730 [Chloroflexota bacterium]
MRFPSQKVYSNRPSADPHLIGGKIPVCPSGGFSSFGEATSCQGFMQIYEVVVQLRGQAGGR